MKSSDTAVFVSSTTTPGFPGYAERSGETVVLVRELGDDERDAEVGRMYRVRFCDGTETDAFADELRPTTDPAKGALADAAPELLTALKLCKEALGNYISSGYSEDEDKLAYRAAKAAIRKAEGGAHA